jgi:putative restriction endonuclease
MDVVEAMLAVKQFGSDSNRAPNKPLLLLLALSKFASSGSSTLDWDSEVEVQLKALLAEFGVGKNDSNAAAYSFTRLRNDKIWELSRNTPDDSLKGIRADKIAGHFSENVEIELMKNPQLVFECARAIAQKQFPDSIIEDVLIATGFNLEIVMSSKAPDFIIELARKRDSRWPALILGAWDRSCAFCGFDGKLGNASVGLEAAHIHWFNFGGPDTVDNGISLCALHHKLLDRGVIGFQSESELKISNLYSSATESGKRVHDLHGYKLKLRIGTPPLAESSIVWHQVNVFKSSLID